MTLLILYILISLNFFFLNSFIDVTKVLCELELSVKRVKVFTAPDGTVMDLLFVTDTRYICHFDLKSQSIYMDTSFLHYNKNVTYLVYLLLNDLCYLH